MHAHHGARPFPTGDDSLAPLEETIVWVEMTLLPKKMYAAVPCAHHGALTTARSPRRAQADRPPTPHASAHHGARMPSLPTGTAPCSRRSARCSPRRPTSAPPACRSPRAARMQAPTTARPLPPLPALHSPQVLVRGLSSAPLPSLLNLQIELRKCCNHPFLIRGVEQSVIATDCYSSLLIAC